MKIILRTLFILFFFVPMLATAQSNYMNNPLVRAAMAAYESMLSENPEDYKTYYSRAMDYYRYEDYERALEDLNMAIKYYPRGEALDLSQAYTIRGLIYQGKGEYTLALSDFNEALQLDPSSRYSLIGRGDLLREMGDYKNAKADYQLLLRREGRSQEAFLGLAIIAYNENNVGTAEDYMRKAQEANPTNAAFYMERGRIYEAQGEMRKAADDYVMAMIYGENNGSVLAINDLSKVAYQHVIDALSDVISNVDEKDKGYYYYIRATIHKNNDRYAASIKDWNTIIENRYLHYHNVFFNRGYCYMRLGQFEYAIEDVSKAIRMKRDVVSYYVLRSKLYRIMGQYDLANEDITMAATYDQANTEMLQERGLLAAEQADFENAIFYLSDAIMYRADDMYAYLLRAYTYERMEDQEAAYRGYEMILSFPEETPTMSSMYGFALLQLGRPAEAEAWLERVLASTEAAPMGRDYYMAACLYAQMGDKESALQYLEKAFEAGYGDYFNLYFESDSPISLAPLRGEAEFRILIQSYSHIFS